MDWLRHIFGVGRLKREPGDQNAGRVLSPASVQRTQLGLKEVDLPRGVVTLRSGEARAFLRVTGYSAHVRSEAQARAWLQGYARALNTLPGNAVLLVRSRPGGLEGHLDRQRAQTARLAEQEPGGALARLAADQLAHARHLQDTGQVRQTDQYVALHSPKGDVGRLLSAVGACRRHLETASVRAELVTDRALLDALAAGWHPNPGAWPETFTQDFGWQFPATGKVYTATLRYAPKDAQVDEPFPPSSPRHRGQRPTPPPKATVRSIEVATNGSGEALPR